MGGDVEEEAVLPGMDEVIFQCFPEPLRLVEVRVVDVEVALVLFEPFEERQDRWALGLVGGRPPGTLQDEQGCFPHGCSVLLW
ncbi:hypothetical protein ASZ90_016808 [hydrocarbon metagenome]|uniref:Uncharacterized protein n=1 Tax=hydrocarbon metagenome TaxID=938273 RepID=A0A0W8EAT4_9ZZZZ